MKRLFLVAGLFAGLLLVGREAQAQTGTARGKILDEQGQPVGDAVVAVEYLGGVARKFETKTGKKGEYTQVGLQSGVYRFTVSKDGYVSASVEARVNLGDPTYLPDIKLASKAAAAKAAGGGDKAMEEVRGMVDKAIEMTKAGKLSEAEAVYKEAIAKNPTIPQLHHNLAIVYGLKKDTAAAEAEYLKTIEVRADYSEAYAALSNLYLTTGQGAKAMEFITKAAADRPDDAKVQFQLGLVSFNSGKSDEASAAFKKAEAMDAGIAEIQFYLGSIAVGQGKTDECVARLEKYLSMSPQNPQNVATAQGLLAALKPKK